MPTRRILLTAALPGGLAVVASVETAANASLGNARALTLVAVLLLVAATAARGVAPAAAAIASGGVLAGGAALGAHAHDESFVAVVCELVLAFTVAARCQVAAAARGGAGLLGGLLVAIAISGDVFDAVLAMIVLGAAWSAGRVVNRLDAQTRALAAVTEQLEAERDRAATDAVLLERARIARDLHDVVAHHVSVMVVQAGGARGVLHNDASAAEQALLTVERTGRAALDEMRRLLGVLRKDDAQRAPQPRLDDAPALLRPEDTWEVVGTAVTLDAGLDLTAFRLVQEAITNARRHGTGPTRVQLSWQPERLEILVDNQRAGRAGEWGHGLRGMVERAGLYGGTVSAGPRGAGAWRVHAVLPLSPSPARV